MGILIITTLLITLIGLVLHRYLSTFYDNRALPFSMGFAMFSVIFAILYIVNFVWFFGIIIGLALGLLCFFQVIFGGVLWPALLPYFYKISKDSSIPKVKLGVYAVWGIMVPVFLIITVLNLFIVDYKQLSHIFGFKLQPYIILIGVLAVGHTLRVIATKMIIFVPRKGL